MVGRWLDGWMDGWIVNHPSSSTIPGVVMVPIPGVAQKYDVFSLTSMETGIGKLYYSVVNMQHNGGLGDVAFSHKAIRLDSSLTEMMTTVAGDRCTIRRRHPFSGSACS